MRHLRFGGFVGGALGLSLGVLLVFGLLRWLGMPTGQLLDWIIGLASFWWLLVVVTLPWNLIPILLGGGVRLFEDLDPAGIELRRAPSIETPSATHLRFSVVT